jgi:hypothetical protein
MKNVQFSPIATRDTAVTKAITHFSMLAHSNQTKRMREKVKDVQHAAIM